MESTNKMLDAFHAMNVVIQKDPQASEGESLLLRYTAEERADLCSRISHLFQGRHCSKSLWDNQLTAQSSLVHLN